MHSRLFQVSKELIDEEAYIDEGTFEGSTFIGTVADYVDENTDRAYDVSWLKRYVEARGGIEINEEEMTITIVDKKKFFEKGFGRFKGLIEELSKINITQFSGTAEEGDLENSRYEFETLMYDLELEAEGDRFGFYIYDCENYGYPERFDRWVRGAKEGKKFYIGGTLDYHS